MKIMSFNTQHCLAYIERKIDFELMAGVIKELGADVVGLNEMRGDGPDPEYTDQTETLSALTGMEYCYFAKALDLPEGKYGNAILSKIPIVSAETVPIPEHEGEKDCRYEQRCILKAKLQNGYTVLITHFGLSEPEIRSAVDTVVKNISAEKCIVMGDFNITPNDPVLDPIRAVMTDTAELFEGERLSYPSDKPERKIDYIFISRDVVADFADIPAVVASDHRPYIAEIKA